MNDSYLKRKAIEEAKHIYEDYFTASKTLNTFNSVPGIEVYTVPKYFNSTCCRCLNPFPHNENNYFPNEGFVCDDCINNQTLS